MSAGNSTGKQISYLSEVARKSIHLTSVLIPIIYLHIDHVTGIGILLAMTTVSLLIDVLRHYHAPSRALLMKTVGPLLREHELTGGKMRLTGATWVLIAATLTLGVFPTIVGVTAFTVLIVSDTFAALIGRRYGKRRFLDKSVVGSTAFAVTGFIVVAVYGSIYGMPYTFWTVGAIGAVVSSVVEAGSVRLHLDDNITIPFSFAITLMLGEWIARAVGAPSFIFLVP